MKRRSTSLPALDVGEIDDIPFTFEGLGVGETITSGSVTVEVQLREGVHATPDDIKVGTPQTSGNQVVQRFRGQVADAYYGLKCKAPTSAGRVLVADALIWVRNQPRGTPS